MSAGTHETANNTANPKRRTIWIFGGAAAAVIMGGLLMQYFRAPAGQAATDAPAGTAKVSNSKPMARVNNEDISYDAVAAECVRRHGKEVLDDMIHRLIIAKACENNHISVTDNEVNLEVKRIATRFNLDEMAYLQMLQQERNITPDQYKASVIWPMLALKKLAGEKVDISEEDIQKAFVRNYGPRVKALVIMCDNLRRANEVWEKAKQEPDNFEKLAQEYSIDPNSRALGGKIPPIPRYTGAEKLESEAFKLKMGEISGVIEIAQGRYVILKCEGRTTPVVNDIEEVRDSLYDELKESKTQQAVGKTFEKIKESTTVQNFYAQTSSGPAPRAIPAGGPAAANAGGVQPASATQTKPTRQGAPAAPATGAAPPRVNRN